MTEPFARPTSCAYELNPQLIITSVGADWDRFAIENGAPDLVAPHPVGRPLLMYMTDAATVHLYELLYERVSRGLHPLTFPVRCDGPVMRRYLDLTIAPRTGGGYRTSTVLVRSEGRGPLTLLDPAARRRDDFVLMCSWCNRVKVNDRWVEVEVAVSQLHLFARDDQPKITHGICDACHERMMTMLTDDSTLPSR